jgi:alkylation response protein AidB-like acyl-CoA dehydrogenase
MIQQLAKKVAQTELLPVADKLTGESGRAIFLANLKQLAELGFLGLNIDSQYGGAEAGTVVFSLAITEIAKACASTAVTMSVNNMVAEVMQAVASAEQKKSTYLSYAAVNIPRVVFA